MAKQRKPTPPRRKDRHKKKSRTWRIAPELIEALQALADRNRHDVTLEVTLALEAHLTAAGLWPPE